MSSALGVDVRKDGLTIVTNPMDFSVTFMNAKTFQVLGTTATSELPTAVDFDPSGQLAYVACQGPHGMGGSLDIIDAATRTKVGSVPTGTESPISVLVRRLAPLAFVGTANAGLWVIDLNTRQVVGILHLPTSGPINGLAIDSTETHLYATTSFNSALYDINVATLTINRTIPLAEGAQGVAVNRRGTRVVVANEYVSSLADINVATAVVTNVPYPGLGFGIADAPTLNRMFIADTGGRIFAYDLPLSLVSQPLTVAASTRRAVFHLASKTLIVTNTLGEVIFVR